MSNPVAPTVPIMLDKPRQLRADFNALANIEEKTGKNTLNNEIWEDISAAHLRVLLWALLLHEDPTLTLEQVGAMMHPGNVMEIGKAVIQALRGAFPEADETDDNKAVGKGKNGRSSTG